MLKTYLTVAGLILIMMLIQTKFTRVLDSAKVSLIWPWEAAKILIERMDDESDTQI